MVVWLFILTAYHLMQMVAKKIRSGLEVWLDRSVFLYIEIYSSQRILSAIGVRIGSRASV